MFNIMPELPEVETIRRELDRVLSGQVIKSGKIFWPGAVKPLSPSTFLKKLVGQKVKKVERRAKILLLSLQPSELTLAIHLKMTGQLIYPNQNQGSTLKPAKAEPLIKHTRVIFNFTDGSTLRFNDLRKFGWIKILSDDDKKVLLARLGREPLSPKFNLETFQTILDRYPNRRLKHTLLDQTLIAGLGNIYVDESCFMAGVRPTRRTKTLTQLEITKLYRAIPKILNLAIKKGGTSARDYIRSTGQPGGFAAYLKVYGRGGKKCKRCAGVIKKIKLAGRGTHYCPKCQK